MTIFDFNYKTIAEQANAIPINDISPDAAREVISEEECSQFIKIISDSHGLTPAEAFVAIALLFLKGACNQSAPNQMEVNILASDGQTVNITKYDIEYACHTVTGNVFLRRFATAMAVEVSKYAETHKLNGDLAIRLNNLAIAKGGLPLNSKERSWANSFCQNLSDISSYAGDRLPALLAEDFEKRFSGKKQVKNKKKAASNPNTDTRNWRTGKKKTAANKEDKKVETEEAQAPKTAEKPSPTRPLPKEGEEGGKEKKPAPKTAAKPSQNTKKSQKSQKKQNKQNKQR
jgi:hypothetical protein